MPVRPPMPNITGMPQTPQNRPVGYPPKNDQKQVPVPQQGMTSMVPQPINVPAIPQTMPQMMSQNVPEAHYIHQLVKNLDKERADLFFRLFNCKKQKRSEDRPEIFMQNVFPALRNATPNIGVVICRLIESLRLQQDTYTKLLEPPIPIVFSRLKQHKPLYSLVQIAPPSGVELTPTNKDRRTELIPIGTFVSLMEPYPQNVPIVVDKNEVKPLKYGTADQSFYVAAPPGKAPPRFVIHFTAPPPSFLTWFTLQFVEYRQPKDILQELLASKNIPFNSLPVLARTPKCNGCSFDAIKVIEEIINTGSAQCPTCHENIVLTDLEFDLPQPQSARMIVSEDEAALTLAKLALADQVCALSPAAVEARSWSDMIFGGVGQAQGEYHPMVYNDTQEYVSTILSMN